MATESELEKMQRQDHDMLVSVKVTLEGGLKELGTKMDAFKEGHSDHETRLRVAEQKIDEAKGAITGLKWIVGTISSIAAAIYYFGGHR